jgi:hypothetical protein
MQKRRTSAVAFVNVFVWGQRNAGGGYKLERAWELLFSFCGVCCQYTPCSYSTVMQHQAWTVITAITGQEGMHGSPTPWGYALVVIAVL